MSLLQLSGRNGTLQHLDTEAMKAQSQLLRQPMSAPVAPQAAPDQIPSVKEIEREKAAIRQQRDVELQATPSKAKRAVKEAKRSAKVETTDGCPAPDALLQFQSKLLDEFSILKEQLSDFKRVYPTPAIGQVVSQKETLSSNGFNEVVAVKQEPVHVLQEAGPVSAFQPSNEKLLKELEELKTRMRMLEKVEFTAVENKPIKRKRENWTSTF